jgi:hypothetical protein
MPKVRAKWKAENGKWKDKGINDLAVSMIGQPLMVAGFGNRESEKFSQVM